MDQVNTLQTEQQALKAKILARQEEIAQLTKYKGREIEKMIDRRVWCLDFVSARAWGDADERYIGSSGPYSTTRVNTVRPEVKRRSERYVPQQYLKRVPWPPKQTSS